MYNFYLNLIQAQPKPQYRTVVSSVPVQQHIPQGVRVVSNATTSNVRVLTSGQTVRLATSQSGQAHVGTPTILRQQPTASITSVASSPGAVISGTTTAATIGGKQILLQKPISLSGQNVLQLVKTSQGMAVQSLPKVNVMKPGTSIQQQINAGAQIVTANTGQQGKTALIGTNVVKLMSPTNVGGNKILMKNSNLVQVGKVGAANAGKPAFVITNKQGQPIRTNQQFIFVTTASGIRTVQTGSIVTSSANNYVSLVSSPQMNTITSAIASGTNSVGTATGTVKMLRGVGQQGKPITFTLPVGMQGNKTGSPQIISMPQKALTIGGKAVTLQLASGNQKTVTIVSSAAGGGIQKTINASDLQAGGHKLVMMPSKRVITHNTIPISATQIDESGGTGTTVGDVIDGSHMEVLDQLDGAFDIDSDLSSSDDDNNDTINDLEHRRKSKKLKGVQKMYRKSNDIKKNVPKFIKLGLYGGAPPADKNDDKSAKNESSTTSESEDGSKHETTEVKMETNTSNDQQNADDGNTINDQSHINDNEHTGVDSTNEYLNTSSDEQKLAQSGDEFIKIESAPENNEQSLVTSTQSGPTPSETEAANILTTIKSGDLLRNNDIKIENGSVVAITTLSSPTSVDDNVKILFSSDHSSVATTKAGTNIKTEKKSNIVTTYASAGDLDALASAALQASGRNFELNILNYNQ